MQPLNAWDHGHPRVNGISKAPKRLEARTPVEMSDESITWDSQQLPQPELAGPLFPCDSYEEDWTCQPRAKLILMKSKNGSSPPGREGMPIVEDYVSNAHRRSSAVNEEQQQGLRSEVKREH